MVAWIIVFLSKQVVFNPTISVPKGYYFIYPATNYMLNDLILFCVIDERYLLAMHKLHLPYIDNACPHNTPFLMKYIVAKANDEVELTSSGISVNGYLYANSVSFNQYHNINLYPLRLGKFKLQHDEFFVLGGSIHSYDSRYFGIVNKAQIYYKARLLFLSEHLIW